MQKKALNSIRCRARLMEAYEIRFGSSHIIRMNKFTIEQTKSGKESSEKNESNEGTNGRMKTDSESRKKGNIGFHMAYIQSHLNHSPFAGCAFLLLKNQS